ncbi:hypothetical protein D3C71_1938500 [compost metagenome]
MGPDGRLGIGGSTEQIKTVAHLRNIHIGDAVTVVFTLGIDPDGIIVDPQILHRPIAGTGGDVNEIARHLIEPGKIALEHGKPRSCVHSGDALRSAGSGTA